MIKLSEVQKCESPQEFFHFLHGLDLRFGKVDQLNSLSVMAVGSTMSNYNLLSYIAGSSKYHTPIPSVTRILVPGKPRVMQNPR